MNYRYEFNQAYNSNFVKASIYYISIFRLATSNFKSTLINSF